MGSHDMNEKSGELLIGITKDEIHKHCRTKVNNLRSRVSS